jgi:short subunit dehydrogenase-like uncharacterized protein
MSRKYDLILFGATGFTGQIIAAYLSSHAEKEGITWAISGRDQTKLQELRDSFKGIVPDTIVADINDISSLDKLAGAAKILLNTVGPFNLYGYPVVEACINNGTHYLDLSGEPAFVNRIYADFHEKANAAQVAVVNCCGFDSIPADYAAWLTVKKLPLNEPKALYGFVRTNASFSGGTWASAINGIAVSGKNTRKPPGKKKHPLAPLIKLNIHFNQDIKAWVIPMPVVDPHIVKRSAAQLVEDYGEAFSYGQFFVRSSFMKVLKTVIPLLLLVLLARMRFFKNYLLQRVKPGTGPTVEQRNKSKFEVICLGKTATTTATTRFSGGDPGYDETAKIFSEAAFCLLNHLQESTAKYGVLTPVQAFGLPLLPRLKEQGLEIE